MLAGAMYHSIFQCQLILQTGHLKLAPGQTFISQQVNNHVQETLNVVASRERLATTRVNRGKHNVSLVLIRIFDILYMLAIFFNEAIAGVKVDKVQFLFVDPAQNYILHFNVAVNEV
jgi:hypothetical protein